VSHGVLVRPLQSAGCLEGGGEVTGFGDDGRAELAGPGRAVPASGHRERERADDEQGAEQQHLAPAIEPDHGSSGDVEARHQTVLRASVGARRAARVAG
jgi:hypothetical protein